MFHVGAVGETEIMPRLRRAIHELEVRIANGSNRGVRGIAEPVGGVAALAFNFLVILVECLLIDKAKDVANPRRADAENVFCIWLQGRLSLCLQSTRSVFTIRVVAGIDVVWGGK